jgi:hypothetical protein
LKNGEPRTICCAAGAVKNHLRKIYMGFTAKLQGL